MDIITLLGISVALAMDAFAVAMATGASIKTIQFRQAFRLSFHFGLFQGLMPVIGWFLGLSIESYIERYAHWVAFFLLCAIGTNMIREGLKTDDEKDEENVSKDSTRGARLVMLSIATSIDALAVGLSLSLIDVNIFYPALVIGVVACGFTIAGIHLGALAANLVCFSRWSEVLAGGVLWLISIRVLFDNGVFKHLF